MLVLTMMLSWTSLRKMLEHFDKFLVEHQVTGNGRLGSQH
jgi:hypothetical protein